MNRRERYITTCRNLRNRYARPDGSVVVSVGGKPSKYRQLESMAAVKYLGCDPAKLGL